MYLCLFLGGAFKYRLISLFSYSKIFYHFQELCIICTESSGKYSSNRRNHRRHWEALWLIQKQTTNKHPNGHQLFVTLQMHFIFWLYFVMNSVNANPILNLPGTSIKVCVFVFVNKVDNLKVI